LTLVKVLVEQHGGDVTATSAGPGQGSKFRIRLPLADTPGEGAETSDGAEPVQGGFCLFSWRSQARNG
jgi:hypothetical protein